MTCDMLRIMSHGPERDTGGSWPFRGHALWRRLSHFVAGRWEGDNVEPDRELDAWLAEYLFGLGPFTWFNDIGLDPECGSTDLRGWGADRAACWLTERARSRLDDEALLLDEHEAKWAWNVVKRYSSTGDGLLAVAEAMAKRRLYLRLDQWVDEYDAWFADLPAPPRPGAPLGAAPTAPLAVARAARAAVEASAR